MLSEEAFAALGSGKALSLAQLSYLAHFGLLAPTTHNTVPQRFAATANGLRVGLDRKFVLAASDAAGRQASVSLGCVIENVVEASRAYGLASAVQLLPREIADTKPFAADEPRYSAMAEIAFSPGGQALPRNVLRALCDRKVVRAEYDETVALPAELQNDCERITSEFSGLQFYLLSDSPSRLFLGKFQELADTTVFNRDEFALELADWLLPNDSSSARGMRGREFGLSDSAAAHIHLGLRRQARLLADEVAGMAKASALGMRSASAVGVITVATDDVPQRIAAGRAYQAMALRLQREGFVSAMHAGITEVDPPNFALRARLRTTHRPTVVFRIGKPRRPEDAQRAHSSRPALHELELPESE